MNKIFISTIYVLSILIFYSCKKDTKSQNNYYIIMDIDNKPFSFNDSLFAAKQSVAPELTIYAYSKTSGQLQLLFSDFSTGTYIDTNDPSIKKIIYQFTVNAIIGYNNGSPIIKMLLRPNPTTPNPITMSITNVTGTYVEGIFSGTLSNGTATSIITNGQFRIPFK
jgi:hypothetical protein